MDQRKTRHDESSLLPQAMELPAEQGFDGLAPVIELLLNQAMLAERSQVLSAQPSLCAPAR